MAILRGPRGTYLFALRSAGAQSRHVITGQSGGEPFQPERASAHRGDGQEPVRARCGVGTHTEGCHAQALCMHDLHVSLYMCTPHVLSHAETHSQPGPTQAHACASWASGHVFFSGSNCCFWERCRSSLLCPLRQHMPFFLSYSSFGHSPCLRFSSSLSLPPCRPPPLEGHTHPFYLSSSQLQIPVMQATTSSWLAVVP